MVLIDIEKLALRKGTLPALLSMASIFHPATTLHDYSI